ncbi:pentapeptide repeat-containing protein [Nocardia salmonicida]|uniref:pentapeptide repeat-containing protein n=1 Tax=Nocardia salmonicida TaxID=53431 RepID=UPI0033F7A05E
MSAGDATSTPDPRPIPAAETAPTLSRRQRVGRLLHQVFTWQGWATLTTLITAVAAVAALFFTGQTLRATNAQNATSRESTISDRFAKATEQLSSDKLNSRVAGIYLLERLANDSPLDREAIVEVLSAFVRNEVPVSKCIVPKPDEERTKLRVDLQAVLTVLGRIPLDRIEVDLSHTCLINADVITAGMKYFNFGHSVLTYSRFRATNLEYANFISAILQYTFFSYSNIDSTTWFSADLSGAKLEGISANSASFYNANLSGADLSGAQGLQIEHFAYTSNVEGLVPYSDPVRVYCDARTSWPTGFTPPHCATP